MSITINRTVLMSGTDYFTDEHAINPYYEGGGSTVNSTAALAEHAAIRRALETAGITVLQVPPPAGCQDGVYTANWGLCRGDTVVLSSLPNKRQAEEPYAEAVLSDLGKELIPAPYRFSGQGDALPCGNMLFCGSHYRTDSRMHGFLAENLGYEVIGLQTVPERDSSGEPVINDVTGWPDSFFYDIDLALAVLRPDLIAWCPDAFMPESREKILAMDIGKIEVSFDEATAGFACNLVSTGETVIMSAHAPKLTADIQAAGLSVLTPEVVELGKGGGYIRCTTLTTDNP